MKTTQKLSIVIPARNEQFLQKTIDDITEKAEGDIEIIVVLDGYWADPPLKDNPKLIILHRSVSLGMRNAINSAVDISKGDYILKSDAHCMFDKGFDIKLLANCEDNWVVVPRRYRLDAENWKIIEDGRPPIDYMFLTYPNYQEEYPCLNGKEWVEKNEDLKLRYIPIDDLMSSQGSCWFMKKQYYYDLELLDEDSYGRFYNEFQEIGLKCWLSGGRVIINKKTWYAHLHKGRKYGRGYSLNKDEYRRGRIQTIKWMEMGKAWNKQTLPIEWLVKKFAPVPGWKNE